MSSAAVLERSDWLLLLLSRDPLGVKGPEELDPIRLQKGMFLLSKRGPAREVYQFRAYDWGPFSSDVYGDLDALSFNGLVDAQQEPGRSWSKYRLTAKGAARASSLTAVLPMVEREWLGRLRNYLTTRSFGQLLSDVYDAYPEYATASKFRR